VISFKPQLKALLKQILFLFFVYELCRLLFYLFNADYFRDVPTTEFLLLFIYGLRFDAFSICALSSVYILLNSLSFKFYFSKPYQLALAFFFIVPNSIGILLNFIDFAYYPFNHNRSNYNVIGFIINGETEFSKLLPHFLMQYWYVALIFIVFELLFIKFYFKTRANSRHNSVSINLKNIMLLIGVFVLLNGLTILGIRGGLQRTPIVILDAAAYTSPKNIPLVVNTPFFVLKTAELNAISTLSIVSKEEEYKHFNPIHFPKRNQEEFKNLNVCVIILESFSKEFTKIGNRKSYTPFLDSLMSQSLVFKNGIANAKTSIEGIPSIVASIPSYMSNPYINSMYSNNEIESIATLLKTKNYSSTFYHGGTNGTMNFNSFAKAAGYNNYFGRSEYNNDEDYDGQWGIWDEPFLQRVVEEMTKQKKPFFSTIFTLSSHNPYKVPQKYTHKFPKGNLDILESVGYADYSLKQFFKSAQKQDWFKNTLFVLCADHTALSEDNYYISRFGQFSIPIVFYQEGILANQQGNVMQQIDIMPSLMGYLNFDKPYYAFGNNVFDSIKKPAMYYLNPSYYCVTDSILLVMNDYKFTEKYNHIRDSNMAIGLSLNPNDDKLLNFCKALIQRYNNDLIENKMKAKK